MSQSEFQGAEGRWSLFDYWEFRDSFLYDFQSWASWWFNGDHRFPPHLCIVKGKPKDEL